MIKAILFDCFGVLVTSSYEPFKSEVLKNDKELIEKFMDIENRSSRGEISLNEAEKEFAELAGLSFQETAEYLTNNPRNALLLRYIAQELKGLYKISMLSNVADDRIEELFTKDDIALFDDMVLSFQVSLAKPDERIYVLAAERLGVKPNECVFVDDNQGYCSAAASIGMKTVVYSDFKKAREDLEELLAADSDE